MRVAHQLEAAVLVVGLLFGTQVQVSAEMTLVTGVVPNSSIPAPIISEAIVRLNVPHVRQEEGMCVPTSAAMILKYFGEAYDPVALKKRAEEYKPESKRNKTFTYWADIRHALSTIGKNWSIRNYSKTESGHEQGLTDIRHSLRAGNPVMIDVHLGEGHTFVVMGYNDLEKVVYVRDPNIPGSHSRALAYGELLNSWHNHRFGSSRSAFFSER